MYHQAAKKSWPIFFWFYPPKKQFFSGGAQISRNGAVQPNFWKSHSANMKPDCRKYLQAIIVAVDKETNLPVFSSTSGKKYDESIIFVIQKRTFLNSRKSNQRMIVADCVSELWS